MLKNVSGQNIITVSDSQYQLDNTITLSETAAFLWNCLAEGEKSKEQLLNLLLDAYDISTVLALNDIDIFVKTLLQNGIIE